MAGKTQLVKTRLTVAQCAEVFREVGNSLNSGWRGALSAVSEMRGMGNSGFFTPEGSSPFAQFEDRPAFSIGTSFAKFSAGASGNVDVVHMYVWEVDGARVVELYSPHGLLGGAGALQRLSRFAAAFQSRDPECELSAAQ